MPAPPVVTSLAETVSRLAEARAALVMAGKYRKAIADGRPASLAVSFGIIHQESNYASIENKALDLVIRQQLYESLDGILTTAERTLRGQERALCEMLIQQAAKTAAGGL